MKLALAALLLASLARAEGPSAPPAQRQAAGAATASMTGAGSANAEQAKTGADQAFLEGTGSDETVVKGADGKPRKIRLSKPNVVGPETKKTVPAPDSKPAEPSKLRTGLVLGGAAVLGAAQGWFSAGLLGAAAGAGLGLAAAWLFQKKDYGAAFGVTLGAIIGTALGGPLLGGLIGAAVGGLAGHFLGKLFGF